jgi:hypothetical protein
MLATVVAAALSPNIGAIPAQTSCQYSTCSSGTSTPFPWWIVGVIAVIVVALIAAYLVFGRKKPPTKGGSGPSAWEPPAGAAGGGAAAAGSTAPPTPPSTAPAYAGGPTASYLETPEDVGAVLPATAAGAAGGAAAGAAAGNSANGEEEPDIDSLMAELDKISGEILKKAPKTGTNGAETAADATGK